MACFQIRFLCYWDSGLSNLEFSSVVLILKLEKTSWLNHSQSSCLCEPSGMHLVIQPPICPSKSNGRIEISNLYPGIFEMFKNQNPITKLWKNYNCGFVPFQTGTYTPTTKKDSKGNTVWNYQEGADDFPQMLWNNIQKCITG